MAKKSFKYLHTMIRVKNLEESISFYSKIFEMKLLRKSDYPDGKFSLAFMGYGPEEENTVLELTYNWDQSDYDLGDAWGHIALELKIFMIFVKILRIKI